MINSSNINTAEVGKLVVEKKFRELNEMLNYDPNTLPPATCTMLLRTTFDIRNKLANWALFLNATHNSFARRGLSTSLLKALLHD